MDNGNPKEASDIDWESRRLCSDGNCIGVIGQDGRCKECGIPYEGDDLPKGTASEPDIEPAVDDIEDSVADQPNDRQEADQDMGQETDQDIDEAWENRKLCSDGNCIGVIGPDGRCKDCGKPYEG